MQPQGSSSRHRTCSGPLAGAERPDNIISGCAAQPGVHLLNATAAILTLHYKELYCAPAILQTSPFLLKFNSFWGSVFSEVGAETKCSCRIWNLARDKSIAAFAIHMQGWVATARDCACFQRLHSQICDGGSLRCIHHIARGIFNHDIDHDHAHGGRKNKIVQLPYASVTIIA